MNTLDILFKEINVAESYFEHEMSVIMVKEDYFAEAGGSESFVVKIKRTLHEFIVKIKISLKEIFDKFSKSNTLKKAEDMMKKYPEIKKKTIKVSDWQKLHENNVATHSYLKKAKSEEEVTKIKKKWEDRHREISGQDRNKSISFERLVEKLKYGKSTTLGQIEEAEEMFDTNKMQSKDENVIKAALAVDAEIVKQDGYDRTNEIRQYIDCLKDLMNPEGVDARYLKQTPIITEAEELVDIADTDEHILESGDNQKNEIKEKFRGVIKSYSSYMKKMKSLLDNGKADEAIKMLSTGSSAGTGRHLIQQIADDLYISLVPVAINATERMLKIAEPFCKKYKIAKSNRYTHDCNWCRNEYKKAKGIKDGDSAADRVLSSMFAELEAMMASLVDLETDMLHIADAINRENK